MNLRRIQKHITHIAPKWDEFQDQNNGFEDVRFIPFTGGGGMFSAYGKVATEEDLAKLKKFMESTNSPRPIDLRSIRVLEREDMIERQYKKSEAEQAAPRNP